MNFNLKSKIKNIIPYILTICCAFYLLNRPSQKVDNKIKLYWFIPDGLRADRDQFNIFKWAENGDLPNLHFLMMNGSYGHSRPVFPGHTPTNFATLLTGVNPKVHGIADGAMRSFGYPLKMVSKGGFSSFTKLVAPIWTELEDQDFVVSLQSVPGSTPPEIFKGNVIKGRWGGWGTEFPSVILNSEQSIEGFKKIGNNRRVFTTGVELSYFLNKSKKLTSNKLNFKSFSPILNYQYNSWGVDINVFIYDTSNDQKENYDKIQIQYDQVVIDLKSGQWSPWTKAKLSYELKNDYQVNSPKKTAIESELSAVSVDSHIKFKLINLDSNGQFRIRLLIDSLNNFLTYPTELSDLFHQKIGPMVDFVDNYPPQLVYHPNDKQTFIEEANESFEWHKKAIPLLFKDLNSDVVIHSVYNPNQMLTSRWWMPFIDKNSAKYNTISEKDRLQLWAEIHSMYKKIDDMLGEIIKNADDNTYIIFSSDHGVIPLDKEVRLNNLFAQKGWLKFKFDPRTLTYQIDWDNTSVIYLQMNNIYINPKGLGGIYQPAIHDKDFIELRNEVLKLLTTLKDPETNKKVLSFVYTREDADQIPLPKERIGDLVISNSPGFGWTEDLSEDLIVFSDTLKGGYKQAVDPKNSEGMLTPFVIYGKNIKRNFKISDVINHTDQYATIAKIFQLQHPTKEKLDGRILKEVFND